MLEKTREKIHGKEKKIGVILALALLAFSGFALVVGPGVSPISSHSGTASASVVVNGALVTSASTSGVNGSTIFSSIWTPVSKLISGLIGDVLTFINDIVGGIGQSFVTIFQSWGFTVSQQGIWAPLIAVIVLAVSGYAIYAFMDLYGVERDLLHGEEDV